MSRHIDGLWDDEQGAFTDEAMRFWLGEEPKPARLRGPVPYWCGHLRDACPECKASAEREVEVEAERAAEYLRHLEDDGVEVDPADWPAVKQHDDWAVDW